jgi:hypothetical protein
MGLVFIIVAFFSVGWHVLLLIFAGMYVWPRAKVASLWDVPEGRVSAIAAQRNVRSYTYTPREFAMYSLNKTVTVYDPGRAYEAAKEFHSERSAEKA